MQHTHLMFVISTCHHFTCRIIASVFHALQAIEEDFDDLFPRGRDQEVQVSEYTCHTQKDVIDSGIVQGILITVNEKRNTPTHTHAPTHTTPTLLEQEEKDRGGEAFYCTFQMTFVYAFLVI